ncbi:uncharacterized protein M421DRAFT_207547 [Didymella exigua CBS 183.55]|uniref:BTB domain-containing protein n=1 Tax=Didymella exigua CBS 183.55 TaxID=1150837 RepID=A0A6A5RH23_9PLEO|nr:uncharacterized protein M421DRAFT_207547 [Didymella exigua CBS 183.55]KAF1926829.1 hypothetical protein M421DRAFT_207547 [Didymella exigua CBS 183.55]
MVDIYIGEENTHWILHEKLLCHHSPFFRKIFYAKGNTTQSFGLPEDDDNAFKSFVGWLYSSSLPVPREESDLGVLFELYLMAEKFQIPNLIADVLQVVREWYKFSDSYPGLRRVQYIYANTENGSPMRHMLVHSIARMMVLEKGLPAHWDKALRKNGQLAVDVICAIQDWRLDDEVVPDARDDPAEGEDLIDIEEEIKQNDAELEQNADIEDNASESVDVLEGEEQEVEVEGEDEEQKEENDDAEETDDTVVGSPTQSKHDISKDDKKASNGTSKVDDLKKDFSKFSLNVVPNGLTNGDFGSLKA